MKELNSRQMLILEKVKQQGAISINDLIETMDASPATLRKDAAFLSSLKLVYRTRGEIHAVQGISSNVIYRQNANQETKQSIAKTALSLINEGDTIILDSGTTTMELAKLLTAFNSLTVITYSLDIANILQSSNINLILVGGQFIKRTSSFIGPDSVNFFKKIRAQKFFLTASGVRDDFGLTVYESQEGEIKNAAISASSEVIALIDSSKLKNACIYQFATLDNVDTFITDRTNITDSFMNSLNKNNINTIFSD